uniref:Histone-lysine N-methyltransferase n=2 Tax=Parascaris univalens TaxID=6257 RepID=A0A915AMP9_PARUN
MSFFFRMKRSEDEQTFSPKRKYMREDALSATSSTHIGEGSGIFENAEGEQSRSLRRNCGGIYRSEHSAQDQEVVVIDLLDDDEPTEGEGITSEAVLNGSDSVSVVDRISSTTPHDDNARLDSTDEVTVIMDSADLASLDDAHKVICESRMRHFYEVFRHAGTSMVLTHNCFAGEVSELSIIDDFQTGRIVFDEERISKAVVAYHVERLSVRQVAESMKITDFDVIVCLLDHVWKERHNTVEGYSLVEVACYIRLERAQLPQMALLIVKPEQLLPSQLVARTLNEPVEIIFIMTALLARMYRWPLADDLDNNWQMIENVPPPNDEEYISTMDGIQAIFEEVTEEIGRNRFSGLRNNESCISTITADLKNLCDEILKATAAVGKGLESLPSARTTTAPRIVPLRWKRRADRLQEAQSKRPPVEISLSEKDSQKISTEASKILSAGEEISVVETRQSEFSRPGYMIVEDPANLDEIPVGSICLARQRSGINFIRCTVMRRVSLREYLVRFTNSTEEAVDISRIGRKIEGWLRIWEGVRVCALYEPRLSTDKFQKAFYSGIVAVGSHGCSSHEMLIFFDNGCDGMVAARTVHVLAEQQYTTCSDGRKVIDRRRNYVFMPSARRLFVKHYLSRYPDWPLVPMKRKENTQRVNVMREGRAYSAYVLQTERQFALLRFPPKRRMPGADCVVIGCSRHEHIDEWVYRGSDRLDTIRQTIEIRERAERQQQKCVVMNALQLRREARLMHNFEYAIPLHKNTIQEPLKTIHETRSEPDLCARGRALFNADESTDSDECVYQRRQTARKSSVLSVPVEDVSRLRHSASTSDTRSIRKLKDKKLVCHPMSDWSNLRHYPHSSCSVDCLQELEMDPQDKTFCGISPYMIPLMSGWKRSCVLLSKRTRKQESTVVKYIAPCGISMYSMSQIVAYLKATCSRLTVDLFTFDKDIRPNVVFRSPTEAKLMDDFTKGYEAVPIAVCNEVDHERPPKIEYDSRRYPFNKDTDVSTIAKEFCSGCSCTGDCANELMCECRQLTRIEISRLAKSLRPLTVRGYSYRSLVVCNDDEVILSGIYECNDACNCDKNKCFNRVVQLGMRFPLELFKTPKIGWGVRTLVDVPAGAFVCTYAGAILTDSQAEECGKAYGDEYFADVNLVEVVEKEKQNAGVDIGEDYFSDEGDEKSPHSDKDSQSSATSSESETGDTDYDSFLESYGSESGEETTIAADRRTRERSGRNVSSSDERSRNAREGTSDSNVEETLQADLAFARTSLFVGGSEQRDDTVGASSKQNGDGEDTSSADALRAGRFNMASYVESQKRPSLYTIDAKRKGNIGRFFNHSCEPNMRTCHVYVDTHDFRLPWIAFFTTKYVPAGTELCWDYGYTEGAVAGKKMRCLCGSRSCRKRLL